MVCTEERTKHRIACGAEHVIGGLGDVWTAALGLLGDLAHTTAVATVPCEGSLVEADACTPPVGVVIHYGVTAVSNVVSILGDASQVAVASAVKPVTGRPAASP
jgi:hypothetical protein